MWISSGRRNIFRGDRGQPRIAYKVPAGQHPERWGRFKKSFKNIEKLSIFIMIFNESFPSFKDFLKFKINFSKI